MIDLTSLAAGNAAVRRPGAALRLLLTVSEAAKALAISERALWQLTRDGKVPSVRVGRSVRYSVDDLCAYIDSLRAQASG